MRCAGLLVAFFVTVFGAGCNQKKDIVINQGSDYDTQATAPMEDSEGMDMLHRGMTLVKSGKDLVDRGQVAQNRAMMGRGMAVVEQGLAMMNVGNNLLEKERRTRAGASEHMDHDMSMMHQGMGMMSHGQEMAGKGMGPMGKDSAAAPGMMNEDMMAKGMAMMDKGMAMADKGAAMMKQEQMSKDSVGKDSTAPAPAMKNDDKPMPETPPVKDNM